MDERAEEGLDPKPPEEELVALCNRYPHVSRATVGQWISNREVVGGRRETLRTYTAGELHAFARSLENMEIYKEYAVLEPRQLRSWTDTGIEQAFKPNIKRWTDMLFERAAYKKSMSFKHEE